MKTYVHSAPMLYSTTNIYRPKASHFTTDNSLSRSVVEVSVVLAVSPRSTPPALPHSGRLGDAARRLAGGGSGAAAARLSDGQPLAGPARKAAASSSVNPETGPTLVLDITSLTPM